MVEYLDLVQENPVKFVSEVLKGGDAAGALSQSVKGILDPVIALGEKKVLDQIYVEGLDSSQVWEQAKLVIEGNVDEVLFTEIPQLKEEDLENENSENENSENENSENEDFDSEISDEELLKTQDIKAVPENSDEEYEDFKEKQENEEDSESDEDEENSDIENEDENIEEKDQDSKDQASGFGLDDGFFSLKDFQKQVLAAEKKDDNLSEDEEEIDYFGEISDGSDEEAEYYDDFFDKPTKDSKKTTKDEDQLSDENEESEAEIEEDDYENAMAETMNDLFDDGKLQPETEERLSSFEKQQRAIKKQIEELEREAVEEKKWTMKGEANAKSRPVDALLDEELEFDRNAKPVPVITQEVTESIEELIRRRIKNYEFDDLPRRLFSDVTKERFKDKGISNEEFEEMGKKSQKSLAEIYEDEHYNGVTRETVQNEELKKKHDEVIQMYQSISYKLDALCLANFIPKPATKALEIKVNTSSIAMEDAQPLAMSAESTLAPQEVFKPKVGINKETNEVTLANGLIVNKDELSKEEKKNLRLKLKRRKKAEESKKPAKKKSKKADVLDTLKQANVQVIGKRGEKTDLAGNVIKDGGASKSVRFKL